MDNLNYVLLEGHLTRDPIQKIATAECPLCQFSIAVNRFFKSKNKPQGAEDTSYFLVECWGKIAESCIKYLKKGQGVRVVGKLKQHSWKDGSEGGKPRERVYIIAEHIQFQPKKAVPSETKVIVQTEEDGDNSGIIQEELDNYSTEIKEVEIEE